MDCWWWWSFSHSVVSNSCNPTDCSPPGSSIHRIFQARILEWVAISFSRGPFQPRDQTQVSYVSCIAGGFFTDWAKRHLVVKSCPTPQSHELQHARLLSFTISQSVLKLMSTELVIPSDHLILYCPLLLPSIFHSIRIFSNESALLHVRWPKYGSFSFNICTSKEDSGLDSFRIDWFDLLAVQGLSRVFLSTTIRKHQSFGAQPSLWSSSHLHTFSFLKCSYVFCLLGTR